MVKLILGGAGSGKTKLMIEDANKRSNEIKGTLIYIEDTDKHMHSLEVGVRFISMENMRIKNYDALYTFVCGLLSANYDIQYIYIDGLFKIVQNNTENLHVFLNELDKLTKDSNVDIIISATLVESEIDPEIQKFVVSAEAL
ncbi:hypothetical protein [Criibacterium bergeronii]|uniref:Twitching motility protein PilT n=1 Tax=Criibacterium bergeronii TaxID=1871336 RepID=A0A371IMH9_9FIRM|nr:hypothetical protein [Criibacterium bergeronii]MBS6062335.1 hypothetical protein [Peptostreptococcaceae bacterium]RDY21684.1 hypothetical protein BBG48_003630 [Criibacterium bergeronii]TRW28592.1 hypothetical protein FL857_00465 [Criibacterium bergeronii]